MADGGAEARAPNDPSAAIEAYDQLLAKAAELRKA
jgi:hypothetical protein